jgi:hypothetical protein
MRCCVALLGVDASELTNVSSDSNELKHPLWRFPALRRLHPSSPSISILTSLYTLTSASQLTDRRLTKHRMSRLLCTDHLHDEANRRLLIDMNDQVTRLARPQHRQMPIHQINLLDRLAHIPDSLAIQIHPPRPDNPISLGYPWISPAQSTLQDSPRDLTSPFEAASLPSGVPKASDLGIRTSLESPLKASRTSTDFRVEIVLEKRTLADVWALRTPSAVAISSFLYE